MGNFSTDPLQELERSRRRGYVGVRIEQGVPLLDRDLNLLADLVASSVRDVLARHLGSGIAGHDEAFAIDAIAAENDFRVLAPDAGGACLVAGIEARIEESIRYSEQAGVSPLTTPQDSDREDLVYLDVWVEEVDSASDLALTNVSDVGVQTSVRLRPTWRVRVAEGARDLPAAALGHAHCALAALSRIAGESTIRARRIVDYRQTGLNLSELARRIRRIEDVLFSPILDEPGLWTAAAADLRDDASGFVTTRKEHTP